MAHYRRMIGLFLAVLALVGVWRLFGGRPRVYEPDHHLFRSRRTGQMSAHVKKIALTKRCAPPARCDMAVTQTGSACDTKNNR